MDLDLFSVDGEDSVAEEAEELGFSSSESRLMLLSVVQKDILSEKRVVLGELGGVGVLVVVLSGVVVRYLSLWLRVT